MREIQRINYDKGIIEEVIETDNGIVKCCDSCSKIKECLSGHDLPAPLPSGFWDNSKDYCSKWEEKKDNMIEYDLIKLQNEYACAGKWIGYRQDIIDYFKKRIEESLDTISVRGLADDQWDEIYARFSWILDAKRTTN